ncbi:hypothetical protein B0H16DRAFT_889687 [Mycena metata]|uniref:Protein YAE1 n=1 Tax=Mycena metata TaxID=1033252 RepID=A0AAD7K517_9AGAR|nr:hypothetical protein B0H16DRAFT_889687 [Mycena metata]
MYRHRSRLGRVSSAASPGPLLSRNQLEPISLQFRSALPGPFTMDSPWDENTNPESSRDNEWTRISSEFTTVGYREGIPAGKESALQEGFNTGFATVGAPLGHEIGFLRGMTSALVAFLNSSACLHANKHALLIEARVIATGLAVVRFTDVAPRDIEAEAHAREHLLADADDDPGDGNEELGDQRKIEKLEDMLASLSAETETPGKTVRPTLNEVRVLEGRLQALSAQLGLAWDKKMF